MEVSLVKTLANKYKTSCRKVYKKYNTTITHANGKTYKALQVVIAREGKKPLKAHFCAIPLNINKRVVLKDSKEQKVELP